MPVVGPLQTTCNCGTTNRQVRPLQRSRTPAAGQLSITRELWIVTWTDVSSHDSAIAGHNSTRPQQHKEREPSHGVHCGDKDPIVGLGMEGAPCGHGRSHPGVGACPHLSVRDQNPYWGHPIHRIDR